MADQDPSKKLPRDEENDQQLDLRKRRATGRLFGARQRSNQPYQALAGQENTFYDPRYVIQGNAPYQSNVYAFITPNSALPTPFPSHAVDNNANTNVAHTSFAPTQNVDTSRVDPSHFVQPEQVADQANYTTQPSSTGQNVAYHTLSGQQGVQTTSEDGGFHKQGILTPQNPRVAALVPGRIQRDYGAQAPQSMPYTTRHQLTLSSLTDPYAQAPIVRPSLNDGRQMVDINSNGGRQPADSPAQAFYGHGQNAMPFLYYDDQDQVGLQPSNLSSQQPQTPFDQSFPLQPAPPPQLLAPQPPPQPPGAQAPPAQDAGANASGRHRRRPAEGRRGGDRPRDWSAAEVERVRDLMAQGLTTRQIAGIVGRTSSSVYAKFWRRAGNDPKRAHKERKRRDREGGGGGAGGAGMAA